MTRQLASILAQTEALLEAQRAALVAADFSKLHIFPKQIELSIHRLAAEQPNGEILKKIQARAQHNANLIQAARQGVEKTRARLSASLMPILTTYGPNGQQRTAKNRPDNILSRR